MLDAETIHALARQLYDARKLRTQVRHLSQQYPQMTVDDGYAIQRAWVALEMADGRSVRGRKIGLTSRAMQLASQITEPDYAPLMDDMFFEQGGDIPVDRRQLTLQARLLDERTLQVTVADHGHGLASEDTEKIFAPFYTTKPEGMGIGLAICRSIIEFHQGRLWFTPRREGGTEFHFTVPTEEDDGENHD